MLEDEEQPGNSPGRRRPPWWFMPAVMVGAGMAAALLSVTMMSIVH